MKSADWPVIVTVHATERARERFVNRRGYSFAGMPDRAVIDHVVHDVYDALREGRKSTRLPRFLCHPGRRPRLERNRRVVWSADDRRAYVLRRVRDERGPAWVVLTCLSVEIAQEMIRLAEA